LSDHGCRIKPFAAKPISGTAIRDLECCSFSSRIPGVIDGLSRIYAEAEMRDLVEVEVDDEEALAVTRRLIREGFPIGPSSGLNYCAASRIAVQLDADATVVTVFPDRMERYFSTELFSDFTRGVS
jgi:cysteine synthase A